MPDDIDYSQYSSLLALALDAYGTDSSYAEDMAKQAVALRARQGARREREAEMQLSA